MRGVKDEEKNASPMFPRLHVNDTDKGGPKAPPRNKMALYEQFSIPSQRSSSGSAPSFPTPPSSSNSNHRVPSLIPIDISSYQKSISIQPPLQSADKFASPSRGFASSPVVTSHELKVRPPASFNLHFNGSLSVTCKSDSFKPHNIPNFKNIPFGKISVTDDLVVPNAGPGKYLCHSRDQHNKDGLKHPHHSVSSALKTQNYIGKTNPAGSIQLKRTQLEKNHIKDSWKSCQNGREPEEASGYSFAERDIGDASSHLSLEVKNPLKQVHEFSDHEMGNISVSTLKSSLGGNDEQIEVFLGRDDRLALTDDLHGESSLNDFNRSPDRKDTSVLFEDKIQEHKEPEPDLLKDHASNKPMENSILDTDISPDYVVRVIGEKHFWETRRAIINQQRIFIQQLFELHRVIKVQRLIAGSPNLLLEGSFFGKFSSLASMEKRSPAKNATKSPPFTFGPTDELNTQYAENSTAGKLLLPSPEKLRKVHVVPQSFNEHHAENRPLPPTAIHCKQTPWNLHPPPENQWLVPFMSPSEGLVYKPFTGSCPPTEGFVAPFYGSCGPVKLNSGSREPPGASYGVSATHQGINILSEKALGQLFIPPISSSMNVSEVEQANPSHEIQPTEIHNNQSIGDNNGLLPYQCSCKSSSKISQVISGENENHHSYEENELQVVTDSVQSDWMKQNVLPLFPTTPTLKASSDHKVEHQFPRVIKVQPHNPRSASESAARIFKRIQEERNTVNNTTHIDSKSLSSST